MRTEGLVVMGECFASLTPRLASCTLYSSNESDNVQLHARGEHELNRIVLCE